MLKQLQIFLGPQRIQALFLLFGVTGLGNLVLNGFVDEVLWARDVQTLLVIVSIIGSLVIVGTKLDPFERGRWLGILIPAALAIVIALIAAPDLLGLAIGLAIGWIVAGVFIFKPRGPMAYRQAVKYMRKSEYSDAVSVLDELIKLEPNDPQHFRFRAEILRLWGKLDRARRDYERMTQLAKDAGIKAVAYNGLAEVQLQSGNYEAAHEAALRAYELAPQEWVAAYNLGMIEDRMQRSADALEHLDQALAAKVPDARHRLLIHLYRARAYARLNDPDKAEQAVEALRKHRGGLNEWQVILQSEQAETLRAVLEADIQTAQALADDEITVHDIA